MTSIGINISTGVFLTHSDPRLPSSSAGLGIRHEMPFAARGASAARTQPTTLYRTVDKQPLRMVQLFVLHPAQPQRTVLRCMTAIGHRITLYRQSNILSQIQSLISAHYAKAITSFILTFPLLQHLGKQPVTLQPCRVVRDGTYDQKLIISVFTLHFLKLLIYASRCPGYALE